MGKGQWQRCGGMPLPRVPSECPSEEGNMEWGNGAKVEHPNRADSRNKERPGSCLGSGKNQHGPLFGSPGSKDKRQQS